MKKILLALSCLIFAIVSFAQNNTHIKFMGIPLTGTITQFQSKLVAKGCAYNKAVSSSISNGTRAFSGTFVGNKVDIYVFYDTKTKIVYRAKALVCGISESIAEQEYLKMKNLLSQKYGSDSGHMLVGTQGGKEAVTFISITDKGENNGTIDLYIVQDDMLINYPYNYNLHIDYNDRLNTYINIKIDNLTKFKRRRGCLSNEVSHLSFS